MTGQTFGVILVGLSIIGNLKLSQAQDSRCLSKPDTTCDKQTQTAWFYNSDTKTCYSMTACNVDASNSFNSSMYCQHACGPKVDDSTTVHTYDTNIAKPSDEIKENKTESPDAVTDATVFATTEVPAAAVQPRQKRSTSNRRHRQQHYKEQEEEDDLKIDEEEEVKSQKTGRVDTKRRLRHTKNKSQTSMKSTAEESTLVSTSDKLPKIAKSARKTEVTGRKMIRDENKHEDLEVAKERVDQEDEEKPKKSPENAKKHVPSSRSRNHSSERKIHGASSTSAAERKNVDKKSSRSESTMSKGHSTSSLSELLNTGDDNEADKPKSPSISDHVEDDDEEFEVVSEKIKKILTNPTYVFSYTNITGDDFVSLQEMVFQSDVGSMQLLEKNEADKLEAERKRAALETRDNNLRVPIKILKNEDALKGKRSDEEETQAPDMKSA